MLENVFNTDERSSARRWRSVQHCSARRRTDSTPAGPSRHNTDVHHRCRTCTTPTCIIVVGHAEQCQAAQQAGLPPCRAGGTVKSSDGRTTPRLDPPRDLCAEVHPSFLDPLRDLCAEVHPPSLDPLRDLCAEVLLLLLDPLRDFCAEVLPPCYIPWDIPSLPYSMPARHSL